MAAGIEITLHKHMGGVSGRGPSVGDRVHPQLLPSAARFFRCEAIESMMARDAADSIQETSERVACDPDLYDSAVVTHYDSRKQRLPDRIRLCRAL